MLETMGKTLHELGGVGRSPSSLWDCCGLAHNWHKGLWDLGPHQQEVGLVFGSVGELGTLTHLTWF